MAGMSVAPKDGDIVGGELAHAGVERNMLADGGLAT